VALRREVLETPDGDALVLDHTDLVPGAPRLLVLHGLEGSSYSVYVQGILETAQRQGWNGTALNFRSCARDPGDLSRMLPNRRPRLYHSGETEDLDFVVRTLSDRDREGTLFAVGVSLGGNVLLKWLGERADAAGIAAAAAVSTPYDLAESARHLETSVGRLYVGSFLATLRRKALDAAARFPEAASRIDVARTTRARSFREFDDAATAPLHDFAGADDYYRRSSSLAFLPAIAIPTLCLSAEDDPFLPAGVLERARTAASPAVDFRVTPRGGHIGFVAGSAPWRPQYWAERAAVAWLAERLVRTKKKAGGRFERPADPIAT
jgi:predicted alpha/beta-fold hydrolase